MLGDICTTPPVAQPDVVVLVHTPAAGFLSDKVTGNVLGIPELLPGVVPEGEAGGDPLVDTHSSGLGDIPSLE